MKKIFVCYTHDCGDKPCKIEIEWDNDCSEPDICVYGGKTIWTEIKETENE